MDENGEQVRVCADELFEELDMNEQSMYRNLRDLCKPGSDVQKRTYIVSRTKDGGKRFTYKKSWFWVTNDR